MTKKHDLSFDIEDDDEGIGAIHNSARFQRAISRSKSRSVCEDDVGEEDDFNPGVNKVAVLKKKNPQSQMNLGSHM